MWLTLTILFAPILSLVLAYGNWVKQITKFALKFGCRHHFSLKIKLKRLRCSDYCRFWAQLFCIAFLWTGSLLCDFYHSLRRLRISLSVCEGSCKSVISTFDEDPHPALKMRFWYFLFSFAKLDTHDLKKWIAVSGLVLSSFFGRIVTPLYDFIMHLEVQ